MLMHETGILDDLLITIKCVSCYRQTPLESVTRAMKTKNKRTPTNTLKKTHCARTCATEALGRGFLPL